MISDDSQQIRMIPIEQIVVLNPRDRGKRKFAEITDNIARIGLKRPVTVAPYSDKNGSSKFWLVCGQGRLEACKAIGEEKIAAIIVNGSKEDLWLMSLAENVARRQHSPVELLREISQLKERGYSITEIARKTDLDTTYIRGIIQLLVKGEHRLLSAVEKHEVPMSVAITIATANDKDVQRALAEAYEKHDLRGRALIKAKRLIEDRRSKGKSSRSKPRKRIEIAVSGDSILKTYQDETIRQRMLIQKAKVCEARLLFVATAIKQLFRDENFVNLVRLEGLDALPQYLADQVLNREP